MCWTQYLIVDLSIFHWALFLRIPPFLLIGGCFSPPPIICGTLLVCFCFLNWSVLIFWLCGMNFYGGRHVKYSGAVSLITWTWCSWDALYAFYAGSLDVFGFLLLLGLSLLGPSLQLFDWGSLWPPHLVCSCEGADRLCQSWFFRLTKVILPLSRYFPLICLGGFSTIELYFQIGPGRRLVWVPFTPLRSSSLQDTFLIFNLWSSNLPHL